jgi:hypothetical protein
VPHQVGWRVTTCVAYGASQLPRIAWYVGHGLAVRRLFEAAQQRDGKKAQPRAHTDLPVPDDGPQNVKLRDGRIDIKLRQQVDDEHGREQIRGGQNAEGICKPFFILGPRLEQWRAISGAPISCLKKPRCPVPGMNSAAACHG